MIMDLVDVNEKEKSEAKPPTVTVSYFRDIHVPQLSLVAPTKRHCETSKFKTAKRPFVPELVWTSRPKTKPKFPIQGLAA